MTAEIRLDEKFVLMNVSAKDKKEAVKILANLLEDNGVLSDKKQFIMDIYIREKEGATGIGDGVAIPHGVSSGVEKDAIAVGILKETIYWESVDNEKIKVIVLFAVSTKEYGSSKRHLKMMANVAKVLAHDELKEQLKKAVNAKEVVEIFSQREENLV
ncbi:PTS sugar transporter subunit IIA [Enterococcus sp. BWT-B8]|uniref:PTS sugar transporter subunit IIA n=1 Tax=unclassified Enterococcus TaxID=2608891 RepID=UPI001E3B76B1|nr:MULTISPECIES: PTS sugar transporter subunit IIA [unclassified Enterococcus]MCB5951968.1 PTS sugar transporter subunit IIA [Enterococcus sp. BWT-B8]MCB5954165.1 PTS sugar transporter subunit IIA [Enterococcus sp. CWB-B31]